MSKSHCLFFVGNIVVVDTDNHRVQIFDGHGKILTTFGGHGSEPHRFNIPMCVTLTRDDPQKVMVTDSVNAKVKVFTLDGLFQNEIGEEDELVFPCGISTFTNGDILISDVCLHSVIVIDYHTREMTRTFGSYGSEPIQLDHPYHICTNTNNQIIVSDSGNSAIKIFSEEGDLLHNFCNSDFRLYKEHYVILQGIATDSDDNIMIVGNNSVYMVASNGRLWEVLVPRDGLHAPVCVCAMEPNYIVVTQRGTSLNHEVSIFHYDKAMYEPLKTAHMVKASTTGKVIPNKPKRIKVDLPLRRGDEMSLSAKAEIHHRKRTFSVKPLLATVKENTELIGMSREKLCTIDENTSLLKEYHENHEEVESQKVITGTPKHLPRQKRKVKPLKIPDSINSHIVTG